jgi:hypothetical protein
MVAAEINAAENRAGTTNLSGRVFERVGVSFSCQARLIDAPNLTGAQNVPLARIYSVDTDALTIRARFCRYRQSLLPYQYGPIRRA